MYENDVINALEDLIRACDSFRDEDGISQAVSAAVECLGYDPTNPLKDYMVSLVIEVESTNPAEAVKEAMKMIDDNESKVWSYSVEDPDGKKVEVIGWQTGPWETGP